MHLQLKLNKMTLNEFQHIKCGNNIILEKRQNKVVNAIFHIREKIKELKYDVFY